MYSDMGMRSSDRNGQFGEENMQREYTQRECMDHREKAPPLPFFGGDGSADWLFPQNGRGRGAMGFGGGIGDERRNGGLTFQDDTSQAKSISRLPSRPVSRNAFDIDAESSASQLAQLGALRSPNTYASTLGSSLSRSATPDPHVIARPPSFLIPNVGGGNMNYMDKTSLSPPNSYNGMAESTDLLSAFSGMNLSADGFINEENSYFPNKTYDEPHFYNTPGNVTYNNMDKINGLGMDPKGSFLINDGPFESRKRALLANSYFKGPSPQMLNCGGYSPSRNQNMESLHANNPLGSDNFPLTMGANVMDSRALELHNLRLMRNRMPITDPMHLQHLRSIEYAASQVAITRKPVINNKEFRHMDLIEREKAYVRAFLALQRPQIGVPYNDKFAAINNGFYGEQNFPCGMRNFAGNLEESLASALLEEFKSNKTKYFELSEIVGHVVEFSADQYGSRFIQQKLETATEVEKNMIFCEIMPQALTLMTDVFGNYVIQKFFEQGSPAQIRELANQLNGKVLALSLQMYGCRVIQKAIEVVDLDQQTKMVNELNGNIMRCVHDQNGNHVIQKCIECIPEDAIQFIVSTFYDQVVTLSTHPYGCRVIQRVLEHCHDPKTQQIMMDEVLKFVCMLAQDQYGNYVIQHVLEHGKPHERSTIIRQLTGQIVHMSQQKFASNVVEKCLTFGDIVERQTLVTEMLGTTDENEPLQAMMKDQFGNYVVQKVLETCDEQQLELILSRIKVHLNALKKFTYGKHIFARVEKLVAAGERRISSQAIQSS